jgi:hypothetical protein
VVDPLSEEQRKLYPGRVTDLKGRVIIFNSWPDPNVNAKDKHADRFAQKIKDIEKKYNCVIKIDKTISESNGDKTIATSVLAGKPKVDIWSQNGWVLEFLPHYTAGLLQPLEDLKVFDFKDTVKFKTPTAETVIDGKHYGVCFSDNGVQGNLMMFFNKTVLNACGVTDDPYELQKRGEWTWDKFSEICKKVALTPGFTAVNDADGQLYQALLLSYGTDFITKNPKTGEIKFNGGSTAARLALTHYIKLTKDKDIKVPAAEMVSNTKNGFSWFSMYGNPAPGFINTSVVAFTPGYYLSMKWVINSAQANQDIKDNYGMVYIPTIKAKDKYKAYTSVNTSAYYSIPYGVKKPAEIATIINALAEPDVASQSTLRAEQLAGYEAYLPTNDGNKALEVMNSLLDTYYTVGHSYYYNELATGCGVYGNWMAHVGKIANSTEDAGSVLTSVTDSYNNSLKKIFQSR